jgi:ABC-2 type transport system permease protein
MIRRPSVMTRLLAAEFRKLVTTRLWLWLLLASMAWTAGYSALAITLGQRPGGLMPPLAGAAGQHALFAIGAGGAAPLAAILAAASVAGEFRHRTAAATFLATPRRGRVIAAKLAMYLLAGAGYAAACVAVGDAVALPWLAARGTPVPLAGNGNLRVLGAVIISAALFGVTGAGLGALLGSEVIAIAGLVLYLYVVEPLISHITALGSWTAYLPGVAADGLTQASQAGVRLLPPWQGGLVLAAWATVIAWAGALAVARRDIT